jgi:Type IV pilin-like G and H, putative
MGTSNRSNRKSSATFKFILISIVLFILQQFFASLMWSPPSHHNHTVAKVAAVSHAQKEFYIKHGKFNKSDSNLDSIAMVGGNLPNWYQLEMKDIDRKLIVAVRHKSPKDDKEKSSFGIIQVLKSEQIQQSKQKNQVQWQNLQILSVICKSEKSGIPLPSDIELANFSVDGTSLKENRCPVGYTQESTDWERVHLPTSNIYRILAEQYETYEHQKKFAGNLPSTPNFITTNTDNYHYQIQANAKQLIVSAQPKSFEDPSDWTYLAIIEVKDGKRKDPFNRRYCRSETPNISIPTIAAIAKLSKDCPAGYKWHFNAGSRS